MASNKILIIYQEAVNATVWKPISVWYISLWFLWLGLLVVDAVVNYNCKKCFDSLLSNVLCRLVYVKAKKKSFCNFLCFGSPMDFWALAFGKKKKISNMVFRYLMEKIQKLKYTFTPPKKNKKNLSTCFKIKNKQTWLSVTLLKKFKNFFKNIYFQPPVWYLRQRRGYF